MSQMVHEFTVVRRVQGSRTEFELKASFDIIPKNGIAELTGEIFLIDGGIPWDGRLTNREKEKIEESAYEAWKDENEAPQHHSMRDDACIVDGAFDDGFDVDMAMKVAGRGSISW